MTSQQDQEALHCLKQKSVRVEVDGIHHYATHLLWVKNFPELCAPKEAVLPQLRSTEKQLSKAPDMA